MLIENLQQYFLISSYFTAASLYSAKYYSLTLDKGPHSCSHHIYSSATLLNSLWAPSSGHFFLVCSFNHLTFLCNIGGDGEDCQMLSVRKLELDKKLSDGHKGFRFFLVARLTLRENNYSWSTCPLPDIPKTILLQDIETVLDRENE